MASKIEDIFSTSKAFFTAQLSGVEVMVGYPDERADVPEDAPYPIATLNWYDTTFDAVRRIGGTLKNIIDPNPLAGILEVHPLAIPTNFHFQLDLLTVDRRQHWVLGEKLKIIFGRRWTKLVLPNAENIFLIAEDVVPLMGLEGLSVYRTTYSYYVQTKIEDTESIQTIYKILSLHISNAGDGLSEIEVS